MICIKLTINIGIKQEQKKTRRLLGHGALCYSEYIQAEKCWLYRSNRDRLCSMYEVAGNSGGEHTQCVRTLHVVRMIGFEIRPWRCVVLCVVSTLWATQLLRPMSSLYNAARELANLIKKRRADSSSSAKSVRAHVGEIRWTSMGRGGVFAEPYAWKHIEGTYQGGVGMIVVTTARPEGFQREIKAPVTCCWYTYEYELSWSVKSAWQNWKKRKVKIYIRGSCLTLAASQNSTLQVGHISISYIHQRLGLLHVFDAFSSSNRQFIRQFVRLKSGRGL